MEKILFQKKLLGNWRRYDGELLKHVNEESMFREIEQLVNDGWALTPLPTGIAHSRMYELTKA